MKRATGPGKVEELSAPPGRDDFVQGALLFNFDFDDDVVKPEHRQWLDDNAVPLLRPNNGARAFLNGMASQAGAADYNRDLSRRREEDVKRFLMTKGVSPDRLTATFSGEDLSVSQLHDDERDRGVCVWLQVADAGKPRVIPHTPSPPDTLQAPPELVTPRLQLGFALGGGTILANALPSLSNANIEVRPNEVVSCTVTNAAGREMFLKKHLTPTSSSSHIFATAKLFDPGKPEADQRGRVKIVQSPQVVNVRGVFPGRNDIVFTKPASQFVDIVGTVTVLFDAKVFFHFVDGPPGIKTSRTPGVEAAFITTMNRIYRGQVGIVFASAGANPSLKVPGVNPRRGGVPVFQAGTTNEHKAIVSNRKHDSLFNVFFVGEMVDMSLSASPADFLGLTSFSDHSSLITKLARKLSGVPGRCCLLRDPQPRDPAGIDFGVVIAHEAGHALDEEDIDDEARKDQLMFGLSESKRTGTKIPFLSAFDMLSSAVQFPP
jgi:OmpA family